MHNQLLASQKKCHIYVKSVSEQQRVTQDEHGRKTNRANKYLIKGSAHYQLLPRSSKFILAHLGDLYINLMLLTDLTHKSVLKKQMQMICHQLSSFQKTSGSYGHFFNQRPLSFTQQLRIIRLEDTHGHSKLASDRINYLLGPE